MCIQLTKHGEKRLRERVAKIKDCVRFIDKVFEKGHKIIGENKVYIIYGNNEYIFIRNGKSLVFTTVKNAKKITAALYMGGQKRPITYKNNFFLCA